jgi:hypothetical protein
VSSHSRLNKPPIGTFTREDFERAWQGEPPVAAHAIRDTAIVLVRNSPHDRAEAGLAVLIDNQLLGEIRHGQLLTHAIEPGAHVVTVCTGWFAQTLSVDVRSNERVRLRCGRGSAAATWITRLLPFVNRVRAWIARD